MELIDEALELGHGVVALVGGDLLIDGESHGFDGGAHLADGVSIVRRGVLVQRDEHGAQLPGDALGRAGLMEEVQEFLLSLLLVRDPGLLGVGKREAPFANPGLLVFGQRPQPIFEPAEGGIGPFLEPLRLGVLHKARGFLVVFLQGCFKDAHLARIDGVEQDAAVGNDPVEEVGTQPIVAGIDPVEIPACEPPFESLPELYEEGFVLRNGFVPGQQRRESLSEIMALDRGEIDVVIDLPEDKPVCVAIERKTRAASEEDEQSGGTPRPRAAPHCPFRLLYLGVSHGSCCYVLKSSAVNQGMKRATDGKRATPGWLGWLAIRSV